MELPERIGSGLPDEGTGDDDAPYDFKVGPASMEGAHEDGLNETTDGSAAVIDGLVESCVGSTEGSWVGVDDNDSACRETGM